MNEVTSCDTSNSVEEKSKIDAVKLNSKPSTSESSALESSKLASQSGGAPGGVVFAGGESKGEAELDVYTTWIRAGDRVEVGDGRRHDGGAGRARLVRFPAVYGRRVVETMKSNYTGMNEVTSCESSKGVEGQSRMDDGAVKMNSELSTSDSFPLESSKHASQSGGAPEGLVFAGSDSKGGEEGEKRSSTCIPHGSASVIGRRRAMEDA